MRFHLLQPRSRLSDHLGALRTHQCLRRVLGFAERDVPYLETLVAYFLLHTLTRQMVRYGHEFGGNGSKWLFCRGRAIKPIGDFLKFRLLISAGARSCAPNSRQKAYYTLLTSRTCRHRSNPVSTTSIIELGAGIKSP